MISRLQSFTDVQARKSARHPGCSYRSAYTLGSRGFYVRAYHGSLPPRAPDMLTVRFGQLTVRGLSPLQIRSLVGCSPNGDKLFLRGGRVKGCYFSIGPHEWCDNSMHR